MRYLLMGVLMAFAYSARAESLPLDRWEVDRSEATQSPVTLSLLQNRTGAQGLSRFAPVTLSPGATITVTCLLKFDHPPADPSTGQLRIGLFGAAAGAGTDLQAMRGFVIDGGVARGHWETLLRERIGPSPRPCVLTNTVGRGTCKDPGPATDDASRRVVLSVRRDAPGVFSISGFWGPHAFTFDRVVAQGDYDRFDCVAVLNGASSGVTNLIIENGRVTPP